MGIAQRRLMVVGAMPGNLGMRVVEEAMRSRIWGQIRCYDIGGHINDETFVVKYLDLTNRRQVIEALEKSPTDIVCTVGVNTQEPLGGIAGSIQSHMHANVFGPMQLLTEAIDMWGPRWRDLSAMPETGFNFVAVSSNSAHIARSQSAGYCASKAALSMAIRCVARRVADSPIKVWGYEPGFLAGTPMSDHTIEQFDGPLHRIPGGFDIHPGDVAERIVSDLIVASRMYNGTMARLDGGEQ